MTVSDATPIEVLPRTLSSKHDLLIGGFLARYKGQSFKAYELDMRIWVDWCRSYGIDPIFGIERPHIELFARYLEMERHNAPASVARRLTCLRTFFWLMQEDGVIVKSPAVNVKMPRWQVDLTKKIGLERKDYMSLMDVARSSTPADEALIALLGQLGLRVSEACSLNIEDFQEIERGHRVVRFVGKNTKAASMPIPIPVLRSMERAAGERTKGPLLLRRDGTRMTRRSADRVVKRLARKAGIQRTISCHTLRNTFVTAALDANVPLREVQIAARHSDIRQTLMYDRGRVSLDRHAAYVVSAFMGG
ncbi:tyrosine-type recombinase/integrase [Rhodococcus aetherivorans]|uniref:tyrosine-type recombinase/integrase n=1 Tax=Rhodococcus aetherivorans TaxID=191292 RepID=UPI0005C9EF47|nr:tyrosine-type recombinase/integrase [Rhodococcus aetherivorans]